jgi:hypothetical protein
MVTAKVAKPVCDFWIIISQQVSHAEPRKCHSELDSESPRGRLYSALKLQVINKIINMKTSITKSLLTSPPEADQREGINPSLANRGKGRFFKMMPYL